MTKIYHYIHDQKIESDALILLQVHDELLCEVKKEKARELAVRFKEIMEKVWVDPSTKLRASVPIVVDVKIGENWAEMRKVIRSD